MTNDTNNRYGQIFGTASPFFRTKGINYMRKTKKTNSSAITNTTKQTTKKNNYIINNFS